MDEKEQDITTENVGVLSEKPEEADVISEESTLDLRVIRESKGLTLRDVSSSTRISTLNLKAIEEQRFELLPEPIYARDFIDTYARVIDVDGRKILSLYNKYLKSLAPDEDKHEVRNKIAVKRRPLEAWIWVIIVSGLITLAGAFYVYQWSTGERQAVEELSPAGKIEDAGELQNTPEKIPEPESGNVGTKGESEPLKAGTAPPADLSVADSILKKDQAITEDASPAIEAGQPMTEEEQPATENVKPEATSAPDTAVPTKKKPYTLVIEASELTWIEISKDGESSFEVMLRPGEQITERASEGFGLTIGNAGGVDIRFQGNSLGPLGEHAEVIHLTLPAKE
ncbi:MAG: helix-turn-helix domain-containing protein [Syntrophobacterales bacterium]|nr:MAG: helix-turn-helix domain-containing protein [Syntrophobacterales bacterium]